VALPTLGRALHATESDLEWFSSGYLMLVAAAVLPAGLIGDRFGRKKLLVASLAVFGAGSEAFQAQPPQLAPVPALRAAFAAAFAGMTAEQRAPGAGPRAVTAARVAPAQDTTYLKLQTVW
jgi:MFS family permease